MNRPGRAITSTRALLAAHAAQPVDAILADPTFFGAALLAGHPQAPFNCAITVEPASRDDLVDPLRGRSIGVGKRYPANHRQPEAAVRNPLRSLGRLGELISGDAPVRPRADRRRH